MTTSQHLSKSVKFKKLYSFVFASSSLLAAGFVLTSTLENWQTLLLLLYANATGVFLVYRLNDCIDQDMELKLNLKKFFEPLIHKIIVVQFILVVVPLSILILNEFTFLVLGLAGALGVLYSLTFKFGAKSFRIKNLFLIKNVAIGVAWGSLVLIGAGQCCAKTVLCLFVFSSLQVFIGSAVRDVPDVSKDAINGVSSLPVKMGIGKAITFLHLINFLSILCALLCGWETYWVLGLAAVGIWRTVNLSLLRANPENRNWSQGFNLASCFLIFLVALGYVLLSSN